MVQRRPGYGIGVVSGEFGPLFAMAAGNTSCIRIPSRLLGVSPIAIYSAQVVDMAPSPAHGFLCDYLTDQGRLLRDALPTLADAITLITSVPLCVQLSKAVDAALRCTPGAVHLLPAQ